ncbi:MAG: ATP-binding protein [Bacteroidia bacterium]|nr:ATP-binding protein [Bacteroidia bacterium]
MLVQLSVRNYKVFKDEVKLTLFASNYDKTTREQENVFEVPKFGLRILKSAVIYGANASGKTKLIDAVRFMKDFILNSSKESQQGEQIETEAFRLNAATTGQPSLFEIIFIYADEMYRYGFEVTPKEVISEWFYHRPNTKEVEIFFREGQNFNIHPRLFKKGNLLVKENMVRNNALMLSVAAQFNDELSRKAMSWFKEVEILSGLELSQYWGYVSTEQNHDSLLNFLQKADMSIDGFAIDYAEPEDELSLNLLPEVHILHQKYDEANLPVGFEEFQMSKHESSGTIKFFAFAHPTLQALKHGNLIFIDELDSKIHPNLVCKIIELFNSIWTNPHNAQLIFNTHDTNLLSSGLFRRDQIWFVEKNRFGAAALYSLASFKTDDGGRKTDNFEENYLRGRYGGVPVLGDFSKIFPSENPT